jgi:thioredoxin reductase
MTGFDTIIVGGGPAGLSAALVLGRCRRRVLILDAAAPRNRRARRVHGFLTRDHIPPMELLRLGREQLRPYPVIYKRAEVRDAARTDGGFSVVLADGRRYVSRSLLLATGMVDVLPPVKGVEPLYGTSVFHCPYCDGWEARDAPVAAYGDGPDGLKLALALVTWTRDVTLFTDGTSWLKESDRKRLDRHGVVVRTERIERLDGRGAQLRAVVLAGGERVSRRFLFFKVGKRQASALATKLGCKFDDKGEVRTNKLKRSCFDGLYVAGDAASEVQLGIIAAADGARAAFAINVWLQGKERR